jgi:hypothetical protein
MNELDSVKTIHQNCSIEIEFSSGKPHPLCSLPATAWAAHIQKASDVGRVAVDSGAGPSFPPKIRREDERRSVVTHVRRRRGRCVSYGRRGRQGSSVETGTGTAAGGPGSGASRSSQTRAATALLDDAAYQRRISLELIYGY